MLWNSFIAASNNATFLFDRNFMDYHKDRFEDYSLLIYKAEKLVAVLPANRVGDTVFTHQGLTYGGLVTHPSLKLKEVLEVFKSILIFLNNQGVLVLNIKSLPSIYASTPNNQLDYLMFLIKATLKRRDVLSVLDCRFKSVKLSNNRKRGVKKAKANSLIVKEEVDFEGFWNSVLIPNLKLQHKADPVHSLAEIKLLHSLFPKNIRQFNVYKDQQIVAGVTIFETKTVAHAQYISATENKQELGSLDILFQHLINDVFADKLYFDFGISNLNQGLNINDGLLYWKESFGARTITQDFYSIKTTNHHLLNSVFI